jgi:hypothetical protein
VLGSVVGVSGSGIRVVSDWPDSPGSVAVGAFGWIDGCGATLFVGGICATAEFGSGFF